VSNFHVLPFQIFFLNPFPSRLSSLSAIYLFNTQHYVPYVAARLINVLCLLLFPLFMFCLFNTGKCISYEFLIMIILHGFHSFLFVRPVTYETKPVQMTVGYSSLSTTFLHQTNIIALSAEKNAVLLQTRVAKCKDIIMSGN